MDSNEQKIPWLNRDEVGWWAGLVETAKLILFRPDEFFDLWEKGGSVKQAGLFAFYVSVFPVVVGSILTFMIMAGGFIPFRFLLVIGLSLVLRVLFSVMFGIFLGGGVLYIILKILGSKERYTVACNFSGYIFAAQIFLIIPILGGFVSLFFALRYFFKGLKRVYGCETFTAVVVILIMIGMSFTYLFYKWGKLDVSGERTKKAIEIVQYINDNPLGDRNKAKKSGMVEDLVAQMNGGACKYRIANGVDSFDLAPIDQSKFTCKKVELMESVLIRNMSEYCSGEAALCLAGLGDEAKSAVPDLIEALYTKKDIDTGDGIIPVKRMIAIALGSIGDERAIEPLIEVLQTDQPVEIYSGASGIYEAQTKTYHGAVMTALGMFGSRAQSAVRYISDFLDFKDGDGYYQTYLPCSAVGALGDIGDKSVVPLLQDMLHHPDCTTDVKIALQKLGASASVRHNVEKVYEKKGMPIKTESTHDSLEQKSHGMDVEDIAQKGYALYKQGEYAGQFKDGYYTDPIEGRGFEFWSNGVDVKIDKNQDGYFETIYLIEDGHLKKQIN